MKKINCFKCYRCKHIGNILFCPFFDLNPCIRGEHEMVLPEKPKPVPKVKVLRFPPSKSKCVPFGVFIMKQVQKGATWDRLAYLVGINAETIRVYVNKVLEYNGINERMLKTYVIE